MFKWAEEKSDWSTWSPTLTLYPSQGWVLGVFLTFRCVLLAKGKKHCEHRMGSSYQHRCWGQMGRESSVLDLVAAEVRVKTFHALNSSWSNVGWLDSANNAVPALIFHKIHWSVTTPPTELPSAERHPAFFLPFSAKFMPIFCQP